jgi:hypothetical protein
MDGRGRKYVAHSQTCLHTTFHLRIVLDNTPANREMLEHVVKHIGGVYYERAVDRRRNPDGREILL